MADTNALLNIERIVTEFLLGYYKTTDDYFIYLNHACRCYQDFNLYDGNVVTYAKFTLDPNLKWLDMPDDMQTFVDLVTPFRGSNWSFTAKDRMVTTTTTTGGVEAQDDDQGEGHNIDQGRVTGYGAKGAWNKFRYKIDWATRRIYIDDDITEYIVLFYVSSGIKATGDTEVPAFIAPMIDAYLLWKETFWKMDLVRERESRKSDYWREKMKIRDLINAMGKEEWLDIIYGSLTQSPQR
jgi:hypothetical protein